MHLILRHIIVVKLLFIAIFISQWRSVFIEPSVISAQVINSLPSENTGRIGDAHANPDLISSANDPSSCITADGAVNATPAIRAMPCRGTALQLWQPDANSKWHNAADSNYCLARISANSWSLTTKLCSDSLVIGLTPSPTYPGVYVVIGDTGVALESYDGIIDLYWVNGYSYQVFRWLQDDLDVVNANSATVVTYPFAGSDTAKYNLEVARDRVARLQPPYLVPAAAYRDPSVFPGTVPATATTTSQAFQFDLSFKDHSYLRMNVAPRNWKATGLYAPPNQILTVTVSSATASELNNVYIRIGSQTDELSPTSGNVAGADFLRFPSVSMALSLLPGENLIRSPYGGAVIFQSTVSVSKSINITVANAIQAPYFNAGQTTEAQWLANRSSPAPWAQVESELAVIHVPSSEVNTLSYSDVYSTANYYTAVSRLHNELSGLSDGSALPHQSPQGKQWHSEDIQIGGGWGHNGFPIMYYSAWHIGVPSESIYKSAGWGMWHEVGHNYQMGAWSTVFGTESTVNLWSLHAQWRLYGNSRIVDSNTYADAIALLNDASKPDKWGNAGVWEKLVFLDQLRLAFPNLDHGLWTALMRRYREMSQAEINALNTDLKKRDKFMQVLCDITNTNVSPHFVAWTVPVSQSAIDYCSIKPAMVAQSWLVDGAKPTRAGGGTGQMLREVWEGISGNNISDLTSHARYPLRPNTSVIFSNTLESQVNYGTDFGERLRGYLHPPVTGVYYFWLAGNESSQFLLSTDDTPLHLGNVISLPKSTDRQGFDDYFVWEQKSISVTLQAGQKYYFELLHKESSGSDHASVAWQVPAGAGSADEPRKIIDGRFLSPFGVDVSLNKQLGVGQPSTVKPGGDITFTLTVSNNSAIALQEVLLADYVPTGFTVSPLNVSEIVTAFRFVRFQALSEAGGRGDWASVAEFGVLNLNNTQINKANWSIIYYDSQQNSGDSAADKAIDNDPSTHWHTAYGPTPPFPHEVQIDMGQRNLISGFTYLPRQDNSYNGVIGQYKVYVGVDGKTWYLAASGAFADDKSLKTVSATLPVTLTVLKLGAVAANSSAAVNIVLRATSALTATYTNSAEIVRLVDVSGISLIDLDANNDSNPDNDAMGEDDRSQVVFTVGNLTATATTISTSTATPTQAPTATATNTPTRTPTVTAPPPVSGPPSQPTSAPPLPEPLPPPNTDSVVKVILTEDPSTPELVHENDILTYAITLENKNNIWHKASNENAPLGFSLLVTAPIPANTSYVASTAQPMPSWLIGPANAPSALIYQVYLGNQQTFVAYYSVKVNASNQTPIVNRVMVDGDSDSTRGIINSRTITHYLTAITSFTATAQTYMGSNGVLLNWQTQTSSNNGAGFRVLRSNRGVRGNAIELSIAPQINGNGYVWSDNSVLAGQTYTYWLQELRSDGIINEWQASVVSANGRKIWLPMLKR